MSARLGRLVIEFDGNHPVRDLIESELGTAQAGAAGPGLTIHIGADPPRGEGPRLSGSRLALRHSVTNIDGVLRVSMGMKYGGTFYTVDVHDPLLKPGNVRADVYIGKNLKAWSRVTTPLARLFSRDASNLLETAAKNVIYEIIDPLAEYRLLSVGSSLVHASGLNRRGRTILLAGTGGVGKSTSLLSAMSSDTSLSYIGDDMMVVDLDGTVHRHPKRIQVYAYNVAGNPDARRSLLADMSRGRRLLWRTRASLLGAKQSRTRVRAEELFGAGRVDDGGELGCVIWITPTTKGRPGIRATDASTLAGRCGVALLDELWDFNRLMSLGSLLMPDGVTSADLQARATEVYSAAFGSVPCFEMVVPYRTDPMHLADVALSVVDW